MAEEGNGIKNDDKAPEIVKIGEREFNVEELGAKLAEGEGFATKLGEVSEIIKFCEDNEVSPEVFLGHAKGALSTLASLVESGVIDESGEIVKQGAVEPKGKDKEDYLKSLDLKGGELGGELKGAKGAEARALANVSSKFDSLSEKISKVEQMQMDFLRLNLQEKVLEKHPELDGDDVSRVFGLAANDPLKKGIFEHAKSFAEKKKEKESELEKKFAEKHGVDLKAFNENTLKEQGSEGGAATLFRGKKFSFKKGKDTLSPMEATKELFKKLHQER